MSYCGMFIRVFSYSSNFMIELRGDIPFLWRLSAETSEGLLFSFLGSTLST